MTQPPDKQLSRRDALKLLGAAAGASVLANLPSKWSTPQLTAGVLPAHAQSSCYFFEAQAATGGYENYVGRYVEPSYVSQEGIFPASAAAFLAPPPSGWTVRWECKQGCLQIALAGTWFLKFPGVNTQVLGGQWVQVDLTAGLHGIDELPQGSECNWLTG